MAQWLVITLRIIHILTGAAWVGGTFLLMGFIVPTARRLGPAEGTRYLNRFLDHRWFSAYISSVEGLAVLTGLILFWDASGGLQGTWLSTGTGIAFSVGGLAAIVTISLSGVLSKTLSLLYHLDAGGEVDVMEFRRLHRRLAALGNVSVVLLVVAVIGMASAQYLT